MTSNTETLIGAVDRFENSAQRRRADQRLAAFSDLGLRLSAAVTEREAAQAIAAVAEQLFGWDACFLDSYSKEKDTLTTILCMDTVEGVKMDVTLSLEAQQPSPWARQIIDGDPQLILRKEPLRISDQAVPFGDHSRASASLMAVPLRDGSKVIGVLSFQSYTLNAYTEDDLKVLQALADHCHAAFERIRVEEKLREQAEILELAHDAIFVQDLDNRITYWNRGAQQTYGWSAAEAVGKVAHILLQTQFPHSLEAAIFRLLQDGEWEGELSHACRDGKRITVASRWALLQDKTGQVRAFLEVNRDISHQKLAQQRQQLQLAVAAVLADFGKLSEAVPRILKTIGEALRCERGEFWILDKEEEVLRCLEVWGRLEKAAGHVQSWPRSVGFGQGIPGRVWQSREPLCIAEVAPGPEGTATKMTSAIALPIKASSEIVGVIDFLAAELPEAEEALLPLLETIGHQIGQFVEREQVEDALQRSQRHLQALFDNAMDAIFLADDEARFIDVNPATCLLSGYERSELLKMNLGDMSVTAMRTGFPGLWQRFLARGRLSADYTILRKDGTTAEVEFRARANVLPGLHMAAARDITKRRYAEAALRRVRRNLEKEVRERTADLISTNRHLAGEIEQRERLQHELLEITERERNRIGRDLHDDLGQQLSGLALMTKGLQTKLLRAGRPEAKEAEKIHSLIFRAINHAHDLVQDLASLDLKERNLLPALKHLASHARELFKISCHFSSPGVCPPLEDGVKTHLYKIAQEAVTNAIKHGKARCVWIKLSHSPGKLLLSLRNDGTPFSDDRLRNNSMGLRIMRYRASTIGGTLDIAVNERKHTIVNCCVPVP